LRSKGSQLLRNSLEFAAHAQQAMYVPDNTGYCAGKPWWITLDEAACLLRKHASVMRKKITSKSTVDFEVRRVPWRGGYRYLVNLFSLPPDQRARYFLAHPESAARINGLLTPQAATAPSTSPADIPSSAGDTSLPLSSIVPSLAGTLCPAEGLFLPTEGNNKDSKNDANAAEEARHAARWAWIDRQTTMQKDEAHRRLALIESALTLSAEMSLSRAFEHVARLHGLHRCTLSRWWQRIRREPRRDWFPLLAPFRAGAVLQSEIDAEAWELLKGDYLRLERPTFSACFARLKKVAEANGWTLPSAATLRRRLKEIDPATRIYRRHGATALKRAYPHQERSVLEMGAMAAINGDGYSHNVLVRWPDATAPEGFFVHRPKTWFWQDVYSRKIVGYRTDLSEHTELIRLSFLDVCDDFGVPSSIYIDNTRAAANKYMTGGVKHRFRYTLKQNEPEGVWLRLGIPTHFVTPAWGQAKPIERAFGVGGIGELVDKNPLLAGAFTGANTTDKPEYTDKDERRRAVPLDVFLRALDEGVKMFNAQKGRRTEVCNGVLSFDEAFAASYQRYPVRKLTQEQRQTLLLCGEGVTIQHDGTFKLRASWGRGIGENRYFGEALLGFAGQKLTIFFDPQKLEAPVYAYTADGRPICECEMIERRGFGDVEAAKEHARARAKWIKVNKELARAQVRLDAAAMAAAMPVAPEPLTPQAKVVRVEFQRAVGGDDAMPAPQGPPRRALELLMLERMAEAGEPEPVQPAPEPSYMDAVLATLDLEERRNDE
jgi:hypothetical protein